MQNNISEKRLERVLHLWETTDWTQTRIAEEVGCSRSNVSYLLNKHYDGETTRPTKSIVLNGVEGLTDEEIAELYSISVKSAAKKRREINLPKVKPIDVSKRRNLLCRILFGNGWRPGINFTHYFITACKELTPKQAQYFIEFYIQGKIEFLSENVNSDSRRIYLSSVRQSLKDIVKKYPKKEFVEGGVICS